MKVIIALLTLIASAATGLAQIRVVATVPNMGMLAREIGGSAVTVRVMSPPDRDAHYLEARPSMMAALRRADIVVAVGAELEIGWLPAAIQGANNRRVQSGQPGNFEAARHVELLWDDKPADRALGDVHPMGNPHIYLDPERMATAGHALAERLGQLNQDKAGYFKQNAEAFAAKIAQHVPRWQEGAKGASGVVAYHSDADYLLNMLNVPILGHIEPLPGIPPTAAHLRDLVRKYAGQNGVLWSMNFHPGAPAEHLARELGWKAVQLPSQVPMEGTAEDYIKMIDAWVASLKDSK